jgi:hypothetical protein
MVRAMTLEQARFILGNWHTAIPFGPIRPPSTETLHEAMTVVERHLPVIIPREK